MGIGVLSWDAFALILIDVQKDFWTDEMTATFPDYDKNVADLLELCRREGIEVIHLRARFRHDKSDWMARYKLGDKISCVEDTPGVDVISCARELSGEKVFAKQTFDGFQNPELHQYLTARNKRYLLVAGLETSVCVLFTAASAAQRGYLVAVIEDCCGDMQAGHEHTMSYYPFIFERTNYRAIVDSNERWLSELALLYGAAN